jgi:hydroxymethylbilane synthase
LQIPVLQHVIRDTNQPGWIVSQGVVVRFGTVKVGTRGSPLALAQTGLVIRQLQEIHPSVKFQVVPIRTAGDRITSAAKLRQAGKGLFVKEIERALLARKISIAIHSMKDLPSEFPPGLALGAVLERADSSDVFISRSGLPIEQLPPGSKVGTSSLRRQAILRSLLPRLVFVELKGNLDTRLGKLRHPRSPLAGIVVAAAGVHRLYPNNGVPVQPLPKDKVVPAAGQGALGIEIRAADESMRALLAPLHHASTAACVEAERELLRRLEGGCQVPLGAYAEASDDGLIRLTACIASVDGRRLIRESQTGTFDDPKAIAVALETILNSRGAQEILADLRPRDAKKKRSTKPHRNGRAGSRRRSKSRR